MFILFPIIIVVVYALILLIFKPNNPARTIILFLAGIKIIAMCVYGFYEQLNLVEKLEEEKIQLQESADKHKKENGTLRKDIANLDKEIEKLQQELLDVKNELSNQTQTISSLENEKTELLNEKNDLLERNDSNEEESTHYSTHTEYDEDYSEYYDYEFYDEYEGDCNIKGSVNGIYHIPSSAYYSRTQNVVEWFCSIEEAVAAGYRAPRR